MRALLALPFLLLACSQSVPEAPVVETTPTADEKQLACSALARIAKAAADFRDQGVDASEFFSRLTTGGKPLPEKALIELRGVIDAAYESNLPPQLIHKVVLDLCASE